MTKIMIAYFSATGKTAKLADTLAKACGGDIFEIKAKQPYTSDDLDWNDPRSRANMEMKDSFARPEIAATVDLSNYDVLFIGFPIWWYMAPRIIQTFLETQDLVQKTIIPFATSGGSDMGNTLSILKSSGAPSTIWMPGRTLRSFSDQALLKNWLDSMDIKV